MIGNPYEGTSPFDRQRLTGGAAVGGGLLDNIAGGLAGWAGAGAQGHADIERYKYILYRQQALQENYSRPTASKYYHTEKTIREKLQAETDEWLKDVDY